MLAPGWVHLPVNDVLNMVHDKSLLKEDDDEDDNSISSFDHKDMIKKRLAKLAQEKKPELVSKKVKFD